MEEHSELFDELARNFSLNYFSLNHFKSYKDTSLFIAPLTVLIGANASGKTNFIETLRLMHWLARGERLSRLQAIINQEEQIFRGYTENIFRDDEREINLTCTFSNPEEEGDLFWHITIERVDKAELRILTEAINIIFPFEPGKEILIYSTASIPQEHSTDFRIEYNTFQVGRNPHLICSNQQAVFTQLTDPNRFPREHALAAERIPKVAQLLQHRLSHMLFLEPVPSAMRGYSHQVETELRPDGKNLSSVLYHLWQQGETIQKQLLDFVRHLPEQDIARLNFLETPRGEVMVQLVETFGGSERAVDAAVLSDGTLRVLALAAALLSAPPGSMIIVEELDNGIHPSRIESMLQRIYELARDRQFTVLLTSHNPALLNAVPTEVLPVVMFCYRDPDDGSSRLIKLEDIPNYPGLVSKGPLGDLVTTGLVEKFVKRYEGPDDRKAQARAWLESMRNPEDPVNP